MARWTNRASARSIFEHLHAELTRSPRGAAPPIEAVNAIIPPLLSARLGVLFAGFKRGIQYPSRASSGRCKTTASIGGSKDGYGDQSAGFPSGVTGYPCATICSILPANGLPVSPALVNASARAPAARLNLLSRVYVIITPSSINRGERRDLASPTILGFQPNAVRTASISLANVCASKSGTTWITTGVPGNCFIPEN